MPKAFRCIVSAVPRFDYVIEDGHIRERRDSDGDKRFLSPLGITVDLPYKLPDGVVESLIAYAMIPIDQKGEFEFLHVAAALAKISVIINTHANSEPPAEGQLLLALEGDKSVN